MSNFILFIVIFGIVTAAILTIVREKRKGAKCIGCPYAFGSKRTKSCSCKHNSSINDS